MLNITCDKCREQSDEPRVFNQVSFKYVDADNLIHTAHLCYRCQAMLRRIEEEARLAAISEFLGFRVEFWAEAKLL